MIYALMLAALAYNLEFSEIFANLRTEIAIKVLSQEDIHGASTTHLRPSAAYAGKNNDGLEIRTRKRENCSPKSRVLYVGARRQDDNNGEDNDIMRTSSLLYGKGTLLKKKGKRNNKSINEQIRIQIHVFFRAYNSTIAIEN